jgi:hypothetical protein
VGVKGATRATTALLKETRTPLGKMRLYDVRNGASLAARPLEKGPFNIFSNINFTAKATPLLEESSLLKQAATTSSGTQRTFKVPKRTSHQYKVRFSFEKAFEGHWKRVFHKTVNLGTSLLLPLVQEQLGFGQQKRALKLQVCHLKHPSGPRIRRPWVIFIVTHHV